MSKFGSQKPNAAKAAAKKQKGPLKPEVLPAIKAPKTAAAASDDAIDAEYEESELLPSEEADDFEAPHDLVPLEVPERESDIQPSDPLRRYLQELSRYPVLSPEQQHELAVKFRDTGDVSFAKALVTTNLRLVVKIAMEYRTTYSNVLDLIQEGNVGLMKAVANFDPYKGTRLSYYASWWIRSYILKFLLDNFRLVKVGTTQAQKKLFYNLMREKDRLEAQGIHAGPKLLADKLSVREKDVEEMSLRLSSRGEVSIDKPVGEGEGRQTSLKDSLESHDMAADDVVVQDQLRRILSDQLDSFLTTLGEKERIVFQERLMSEEPKTLQEVADQFGITRERARQIEARVIEKLREHMRQHMDGLPGEAKKLPAKATKAKKTR